MNPQKILKNSYIETIFNEVANGEGIERFFEERFPYDEHMLLVIPNMEQPDGLLDKLIPTTEGDFESAKAIYLAYENLTPLQASHKGFWESLSLTDLFPYMQKRWGIIDAKDPKKNILNHFKASSQTIIRHGLAGLWWLVYLSSDNDRSNRFELTEMLFKNFTLRVRRFGISKVFQHREATLGILQFLKDNEIKIRSWEDVANNLAPYFNKLGAVKQLTYLNRDFFYKEMEKHFDEINAPSRKRHEEKDLLNDEESIEEN